MQRIGLLSMAGLLAAGAPLLAQGPNPDILAPRFDLALWSIVVFMLLYWVLRKYAWGPILKGLQKRERSIEDAIDEAKKVRDEMAKRQAEFQQQLADANQQIPRLMDEARRDAARLKEEMRTDAAKEITEERQRLRREIEVAKDQAVQEIWNQAANLATTISARAIGRSLGADDHRRLVDEALSEIDTLAGKDQGRASEVGLEWVRKAGGKI
jgi:F-type H+-transporting ATPase subunit b